MEADAVLQKQSHSLLVGTVEDRAGRAALPGRRLRQGQTGKGLPVRFGKGQRRTVQQVQRLRRALGPVGIGHGIPDG